MVSTESATLRVRRAAATDSRVPFTAGLLCGALVHRPAQRLAGSRCAESKGEPLGASHYGQVCELVHRLRGNAGPRQVAGARVGLAQVFGAWGHCGVTILEQAW